MSAPAGVAPLHPSAPSLGDRVANLHDAGLAAFGIRAEDFREVLWPGCDLQLVTLLANGSGRSLEEATGERVNPDLYDIDLDDRPAAASLVEAVVAAGREQPVLLYRPSWRIEAAAAAAGVQLLAAPVEQQRMLEDKRYVEAALGALEIPTLGWFDLPGTHAPGPGPFVVRTAGQGGGAGMALVPDLAEARALPGGVSASRFVADALSLNLSGCCFGNGTVAVHLPTVQVIGADGCTTLPFGYCGNDAAAAEHAGPVALAAAEQLVERVGGWLHREHGWLGVFGIDVLVIGDDVRFCELNPRFQGSSRMTAHRAIEQGRPGLFTEHLAALAGLDPAPGDAIGTRGTGTAAQLVVHNTEGRPARLTGAVHLPAGWEVELLPHPGTIVDAGGPLARLTTVGSVTSDGHTLSAEAGAAVAAVQGAVHR